MHPRTVNLKLILQRVQDTYESLPVALISDHFRGPTVRLRASQFSIILQSHTAMATLSPGTPTGRNSARSDFSRTGSVKSVE